MVVNVVLLQTGKELTFNNVEKIVLPQEMSGLLTILLSPNKDAIFQAPTQEIAIVFPGNDTSIIQAVSLV